MLSQRLATAAVAIPILLGIIFWGPAWAFRGVVLVFTFLALGEYFTMVFPERRLLQAAGIASGALLALGMANASQVGDGLSSADAFGAVLFGVVTFGLIGSLLNPNDPAQAFGHLAHTILGVLYAGAFLPHFIWLRVGTGDDGAGWVVYVLAVAMAGDTAAYFAGRAFGRHKLMPAVSPKKTVEGAIGAFGGNLLAAAGVKLLLLPNASWTEMLLLSLVAGVLAQLGDLCESLLKRAFGAKDSGWLLPGHGGVLDRADSLVFPVVLVYYYVALTR